MFRDVVRACIGAVQSVVAPSRGADPARLERRIEAIAKKRGVPSWYDRFEGHTIDAEGRKLHIDVLTAATSRGTVVFMPGTNAYTLLYGEFLTAFSVALGFWALRATSRVGLPAGIGSTNL